MPRLAIGTLVDRYDIADMDVKTAEASLSKAKKVREAVSNQLQDRFTNEQLDGASGSNGAARVSLVKNTNASIVDRKKLEAYVKRHGALDLFQSRINKQAWQDRMDADKKHKPIPGVQTFEKFSLRITRSK